ncbi:hypothetical protein RJ639_027793 [Escallonia herrerae]|uniref:Major facilitator superfamily (MFS) profile domain-containing protein n=1 Tax=Escallonia herrerae TaxID=1293975 RepID=A0AA89BKL1_9ASTE|nr:hypothetical protein RJ639_027793 [Escallonia herrerae]
MGTIPDPAPVLDRRYSKPPGIQLLEFMKKSSISFKTHQAIVLIVTFLAYASYHATRKTTSIVKTALDPQSLEVSLKTFPWQRAHLQRQTESKRVSWVLGSGWAPFNGSDGTALLGELDLAFLFVYAMGMYFSGHLGDRLNLRIFLTIGMVGTGLFTSLFGVGYWANVHVFYYYLIVQMLAGLFQSTGWPSVVAVVGNWFGKRKRGLIMGIWNAHTSVGNITGSLVASVLLKYGWGWSLVVPGVMIAFIGMIVFLFLSVSPDSVGANADEDELHSLKKTGEEVTEPLLRSRLDDNESAVGFIEAWKIPAVAPFALCLFFAKLVAYTFLYWLPFYISHTAIDGKYLSNEAAGNLSTLFDVGGVVGGILAGHISDHLDARAITAASFMYCAIPALFLYRSYGHISMTVNIVLMLITGMFVNGPYALITTAVSADLGTHSSLKGNSRALATVTAIIDGTGSIGAAIGPLLTGYISATSWSAVFTMLMAAALVAGLLLTRLVVAEVGEKIHESRSRGSPISRSPTVEVERERSKSNVRLAGDELWECKSLSDPLSKPAPAPDRKYSKPPGIRLLECMKKSSVSFKTHQAIVLIVTFLAYASYHATRKTTSIVKSALDPQSLDVGLKTFPWQGSQLQRPVESKRVSWVLGSGWAPFCGSDGTALLGELDVAFLFVYAMGMYFSGHLGDRLNLRIFLTVGMVGTGLFTLLFGVGYWADVHVFYYYLIVQMLAGLFQSTGWPSVVAVVGNWFGKSKRGLIMGIWNAHTSVGNITGSLVASVLLKYGWGWSMVVPGVMIALIGMVVFLFLPVSPEFVGANADEDELHSPKKVREEVTEPLLRSRSDDNESAVGFIEAWKIPGVAPFALCLFFAKLVAYTFLYWLPFYISHTAIDGKYLSDEAAGNLSTLFDVGGVVGGILAGHISDRLDARAITAASFMYCAIPALFLYRSYGHISMTVNIVFMLITGMFVNGPYALITTAVSADLGTHSSLKGNSRALATVTAIIDGTGSIGAAIGPLLTGYISATSWSAVFTMLMAAALVAGLLLTRLVVAEVGEKIHESRSRGSPTSRSPALKHLGDRLDLRIFLTVGMVGTGLFTSLFGVGYWARIGVFHYYLLVQMLAALLKYGWGWSMVVPDLMIAFTGVVVFLFLSVNPDSVGASGDEDEEELKEPLLRSKSDDHVEAVGFIEVWKIPGVAPFAFCLFFAKLVAYTFLYWLPFYISHAAINIKYLSNEAAGNLSTLFDVGGVAGGILAGHISDRLHARAITAASFMYCAIPALLCDRNYGHMSVTVNIVLMLVTGVFVNGPYALITTAVLADLGTHKPLKDN